MRKCELLCAALVAAFLGAAVRPVSAQTFESVGVRAQGMAGAFVAVADDATASWWNPAGLASGAYLSAVVEHGQITEPKSPTAEGPASRTTSNDFAIAFPALGLSYYRLRISEIAAPGSTAGVPENRQDPRTLGSSVRSVAISQFSSTVGQSLGEHFVLGTTGKLLRAGMATSVAAGNAPLDEGDDLKVSRDIHGDLDVGAMANFGRVRLGLTVRNLFEPNFGEQEGVDRFTLKRQARVGFAVLSVPHGALQGFTAAADADLTKTMTAMGEVRHVAAGIEGWLAKGRLGVRAGASANTVGDRRPAGSVGASVALTRAFHINVSGTAGRDETVTGWSTSVSLAF
jgi:hypothetical protein